MNLTIPSYLKNRDWWIEGLFYLVLSALLVVVFFYGTVAIKVYFYGKKLDELNDKIAAYSSPQEKSYEKEVFSYKAKIEDFTAIVASHKISSNVFAFVEDNTLANVWFSSFSMSEISNEMRLTGEAESMEVLSRQFEIFENSKDYVKSISVFNSQMESSGRVVFVLNVFLDPNIFTKYVPAGAKTPITPLTSLPAVSHGNQ